MARLFVQAVARGVWSWALPDAQNLKVRFQLNRCDRIGG